MADIELTLEFKYQGRHYAIEPYGVSSCDVPVMKDKYEYKACSAFVYATKGKLVARIDDGDFEKIGQPKKLAFIIRPIAKRDEEGTIVITRSELIELYYDDDYRVVYDENQKTSEMPQAKSPQDSIVEVCDSIKELLLEKNRKYGNSALNPCRVFSKADSVEQLKVRIDDKINRIKNEQDDEDEDVVKDLIGYLVLLIIAKGNGHAEEEI